MRPDAFSSLTVSLSLSALVVDDVVGVSPSIASHRAKEGGAVCDVAVVFVCVQIVVGSLLVVFERCWAVLVQGV